MSELIEWFEQPTAEEIYMIAGWHQWADAGSISSGLPQYIIEQTEARKIGEIKPHGFYLFQIPGTHHFLRPEIKFEDGYRQRLDVRKNELFYVGDEQRGLVIFLGDEPHMNADLYAEAFFEVVETLGVRRVGVVGGVYGIAPYDKARDVSCVYSLPSMKQDLYDYAVRFSSYEGGATIGSYLLDHAEVREVEFFVFYAFVPAYDFSELSSRLQGIRIESDYTAWYDLVRRFNHMFKLNIDTTELYQESEELIMSMEEKIEIIDMRLPKLKVREYLERITKDYVERPFTPPLSEVWEEELGDILRGIE